MAEGTRRRVLRRAGEVPVALVDEIIEQMASAMSGTDEARHCEGLSFAFQIGDRAVPRFRYAVARGGRVTLARGSREDSTFTFTAAADTFDDILRGRSNALRALLSGRVRLHGSLWHIRGLLRMMPAVERAYVASREEMMDRHADRYDFRF